MALAAERFPVEGYICSRCGGRKSFEAKLCMGCTYPSRAEEHVLWNFCRCGRRKRVGDGLCPCCDYHPPRLCVLPRVAVMRGKTDYAYCDVLWPHGHCYGCGEVCAMNWPYCWSCESRSLGLALHEQRSPIESHGYHNKVNPTKGRRRSTLSFD